jgi:hypothetical protein
MKQTSVAWIFVSHSTRDLEKVREVRNALEKEGAEPILFFLKCLSDHDELDDLIKREIEARYFFLLCDSASAQKSKWVQDEIDHVKSLQGRKIEKIDLDSDWQSQLAGIKNLLSNATAFFSYSHADRSVVDQVHTALVARDFATWHDVHDLSPGDRWVEKIEGAIEAAASFGFFLHFISLHSVRSRWTSHEAELAFKLDFGSRYIPILLDEPESLYDLLPEFVRNRQWIDYSDKNLDRMLPILLGELGMTSTEQGSVDGGAPRRT